MTKSLATEANMKSSRLIPFGWVVLGLFLAPVLALLIWANYALLALGLEAAFGFRRIEWQVCSFIVAVEDLVAFVWLTGEILAAFLLAELAGWINLLEFDERMEPLQRRRWVWLTAFLFVALVAGEVGIGLFRQWRIQEDAQRREQAVRESAALPPFTIPQGTHGVIIDLNQGSSQPATQSELSSSTQSRIAGNCTSRSVDFIQSLPSIGIAIAHTAVPCLSAICGIIVAPLAIFLSGLLLALLTIVPLTLGIIYLDLLRGGLNRFFLLICALLTLIATPALLIVRAIATLWEKRRRP